VVSVSIGSRIAGGVGTSSVGAGTIGAGGAASGATRRRRAIEATLRRD
jgi:hypothetical protein